MRQMKNHMVFHLPYFYKKEILELKMYSGSCFALIPSFAFSSKVIIAVRPPLEEAKSHSSLNLGKHGACGKMAFVHIFFCLFYSKIAEPFFIFFTKVDTTFSTAVRMISMSASSCWQGDSLQNPCRLQQKRLSDGLPEVLPGFRRRRSRLRSYWRLQGC